MMPSKDRKKPPDRGEGRSAASAAGANCVATATQTTEHYPPNFGRSNRGRCGWKALTFLSLFVAVVAVMAGNLANRIMMETFVMEEMKLTIGEEGVSIFNAYDRDGDGHLNVIEFEPLLERLNIEDTAERGDFTYGDEDLDPAEEVLTIEANFIPLQQDTMSKAKDQSFLTSRSSLSSLDSWKTPKEEMTAFPASAFRPLLPENHVQVSKVYTIIKSKLNMMTNQLSSNRYFPPRVKGKEIIVHRLLSVFHSRPFIHSRFGPQGTVAVVKAVSADYVDIVFRTHAEFQLNEPPSHPFWFTPAQFIGHLIIRKDASHVKYFNMHVPSNRSLNVDMEWMNGPNEVENMEVDIGFMPKMELHAPNPSSQVTIYSESGEVLYEPSNQQEMSSGTIHWDEEISMEEALVLLEKEMYPFKKIEYMPLNAAFKRAHAERKLVHHVLLWGALDDQSCCGSGRTLRETSLESPPVLQLLGSHYVSSWSLVAELEVIKQNKSDPEYAALASMSLEKYNFPVEMLVSLPNGTVIHHINANDLLDASNTENASILDTFTDPLVTNYAKFLKEGISKAEAVGF
uniref:EF-hand domain-containing protein n=1 Tax=Strongylocentrotus purpuratus TaxID=7668 RepID=A0A7M7PUL0_STRPU